MPRHHSYNNAGNERPIAVVECGNRSGHVRPKMVSSSVRLFRGGTTLRGVTCDVCKSRLIDAPWNPKSAWNKLKLATSCHFTKFAKPVWIWSPYETPRGSILLASAARRQRHLNCLFATCLDSLPASCQRFKYGCEMKWNLFTRQQTQELIVPTELGGVPQHANCRPLPPRIFLILDTECWVWDRDVRHRSKQREWL